MATVESLEITIQSRADAAVDSLNKVIKQMGLIAEGISAIGKSSGLQEFFRRAQEAVREFSSIQSAAKNASIQAGNAGKAVSQSMKPINDQVKKTTQSLEEISSRYEDLGKGYRFSGSDAQAEKQLDKLNNKLQEALLKEEELGRTGEIGGRKYEYAIRDIFKYSNQIEALKKQLAEMQNEKISFDTSGIENVGNLIERMKEQIRQSMDGVRVENPIDLASLSDEDFSAFMRLNSEMERAGMTAEQMGEQIRESVNIPASAFKFNPDAMDATFGEAAGSIQNWTQAVEQFGERAGHILNESMQLNVNVSGIEEAGQQLSDFSGQMQNVKNLILQTFADLKSGALWEHITDGAKRASEKIRSALSNIASAAKKMSGALSNVNSIISRFSSGIKGAVLKLYGMTKSMLGARDSSKKMNTSMGINLKTILKYGFGIRSLYVLINKIRRAIREAFGNLAQYSDEVNSSLTSVTSALFTTKNALAVAFAPILNVVAPYVTYLINLLNSALNAIGRFFAALTGGKFAVQAVGVVKDFAAGVSKSGGAAKKAANDLNKYIAGWHEVNNMTSNDDGGEGNGGGAGDLSATDMFTTVPVEDDMKSLADKVRDIFSKLFDPLKQAWEEAGVFVMNSWKYALSEIWELAKTIGRDFLTVWNQPETVAMLTDILYIVGDIGLSIGYLARNFREAWESGETGLHILENIRDIFAAVIHNIALAADATVLWADKLDFAPLLQAIEQFTASLIPAVSALSGVLSDFYTMVLLPLGKWTIEEGLPQFLNVLTAFNEKVNWESLRSNLQEFWQHLEPFAETIGEGLIIFMERVSNLVAGFLNSEAFTNFLHDLEAWMDSVEPEDVAGGIEKLVKALILFKLAVIGFSGLKVISEVFLTLTTVGTQLREMFSGLGTVISTVKTFFAGLSMPVLLVAAAIATLVAALGLTYTTNEEVRRSFDAAIASIKDGLQPALEFMASTVLPNLRDGWKTLKDILSPLGEFLSGMFTNIWQDMINPALTYIGENVLPKLTEAFENLWNKVLVPLASLLSDVLRPAIEIVSDVFTVLWKNIVIPLANAIGKILSKAFEGIVKMFNENVIPIVNAVIEVFRFLWDETLSPIIDFLWDAFEPAFETVFEMIGGIIENIGDVLGGLIEFVSGVFTRDWGSAWNGIKDIFEGVAELITGIIEGILDFIGDLLGGIWDAIRGIGELDSKMNSVSNRTVGGIVDIGLGAFGRQASPSVALSDAEFPGYASGQVIPRNMRKHLAWLGDNNRETEVVSPLSIIKQAVSESLNEFGKYRPVSAETYMMPAYSGNVGVMASNKYGYDVQMAADERAAEAVYQNRQILEALEENKDLLAKILSHGIILDNNEFEQRYRRSATKFRRRTGGQLGVRF